MMVARGRVADRRHHALYCEHGALAAAVAVGAAVVRLGGIVMMQRVCDRHCLYLCP